MAAVRFHADEHGANAVEFALLLPVLILLLFGTMFGASLFNTQQTVSQAAREGARFGATLPLEAVAPGPSTTGVPSQAWFDEVEDRIASVLESDRPLTRPGPDTLCVRFYYVDEDGNLLATTASADASGCPTADGVGDLQGSRVEVTIRQPGRIELGVFPSPTATIGGTGIARFEPEIVEVAP